jgi:dihydrofolate reductase
MNIENEIVIIGGGHIFEETAQSINKLIITRVDCNIDGDIYYPKFNLKKWKLISTESYKKDSENDYDFKIEEYVRL